MAIVELAMIQAVDITHRPMTDPPRFSDFRNDMAGKLYAERSSTQIVTKQLLQRKIKSFI